MKISELKNDMSDIEIQAEVTELADPKQIKTKFGTMTTLTVATLKDDSGTIKLNLWGQQSDGVEEGQTVKVIGGFTREFRDELQVSVGRKGSVKVV